MLNPSRTIVIAIAVVGLVALVLGLATDVGLFGWSLTVLLGLYLTAVYVARHTRREDAPHRV
jgi:membrane protein implicated in regulation of membrane protease activity